MRRSQPYFSDIGGMSESPRGLLRMTAWWIKWSASKAPCSRAIQRKLLRRNAQNILTKWSCRKSEKLRFMESGIWWKVQPNVGIELRIFRSQGGSALLLGQPATWWCGGNFAPYFFFFYVKYGCFGFCVTVTCFRYIDLSRMLANGHPHWRMSLSTSKLQARFFLHISI